MLPISSQSPMKRGLVAGGSPCVGFSRAKTEAQGTPDRESRKIVVFPFIVAILKDRLPRVPVVFLAENVTMDASPWTSSCQACITSCFGVEPFLGQAAGSLGSCRR